MKNRFTFCLMLIVSSSFGQDQLEKICDLYKNEIKPYLLEISKKEYGSEATSDLSKAVIDARYHALLAKVDGIKSTVKTKTATTPKGLIDKLYLMKVVDFCYEDTFPGLDLAFYEKVHKEVMKL